jgi:pyridoxal phosphate enzyme (YggS family)
VIYSDECDIHKSFMVDVAANCREVFDRIGEAAARSGRNPKEIKLLAASKSQTVDKIRAAAGAGIRLFGENYVQEAEAKRSAMNGPLQQGSAIGGSLQWPSALGGSVEWHMIGHLQRNKVKTACELFAVIQTLDSVGLARALDKEAKTRARPARAFIEVNLAGEESKNGVARGFVAPLLEEIGKLSYIRIEGLMAVPPFRESPEDIRPYFRALSELRDELKMLKAPNVDLRELSMGMTHDYPVAIEEGATLVRIGTAIFGPRGE